jgi:hypothetical protein
MNFTLPGGGIFRALAGKSPALAALPAPKALPTKQDPSVQKAREDARKAGQRRKGFSDNIKTSGLGIQDQANVARKTLLG